MRCVFIGLGTALAIALPALASSAAQAAPIIYTETATASGTLNGVPFTDSALVLTYVGDTANVSSLLPGLLQDANGIALFSVADVGAGIFTGGLAMSLSNNTRGAAGFVANTTNPNQNSVSPNGPIGFAQGVILATYNPAVFTTYDLTTALGPVTGPAIFDEHASAGPVIFPTTAGNLSLTSASDVTYTARLVPEPASLALIVPGCVAFAWPIGTHHSRWLTAQAGQ